MQNSHQNSEQSPLLKNQLQAEYDTIIDKKFSSKKWLMLLGLALCSTGVYYQTSVLSILRDEIEQQYEIDDIQFSLIYTYSTIFSVMFAWISGLLNDYIGVEKMNILYTFFTLFGLIIFQISQQYDNYFFTVAGSVFIAISLETISVAQNTLTSFWFKRGNLTLAFGLIMFNLRVTEIISSNTIGPLYDVHNNLNLPLMVCIFVATFSLLSTGLVFYQQKQRVSVQKKELQKLQSQSEYQNTKLSFQKLENSKKKINFKQIIHLPVAFWLVCGVTCLGYSIFYPFTFQMQKIFKSKFSISKNHTGNLQSITYFVSMGGPVLGLLIDKFGKRLYILLFGFLCNAVSFLILILLPNCQESCMGPLYFPIVLNGIFLCCLSSIVFSCLPMIIQKTAISTGYGLISSLKGIGIALFPIIISASYQYKGNNLTLGILLLFQLINMLLCIALILYDRFKNNSILNEYRLSKKQFYAEQIEKLGLKSSNIQEYISVESEKDLD